MQMKHKRVLFLYGKLGKRNKAVYYCSLHQCFLSKGNLFEKRFRCEKCKHKKEIDNYV